MLDQLLAQSRPGALVGAAAGLAGILTLALYLYGIKPDLAEYRELRTQAGAAHTRSAAAELDPAELAAAERRTTELRDALAGDSWDVPLEKMESHVIAALDAISMRHDVQLESVKPGVVESVLMFEELPYDVRVSGDYFTLVDWFYDVERELRPMATKHFAIDPRGSGGALRMTLRLVAYRTKAAAS